MKLSTHKNHFLKCVVFEEMVFIYQIVKFELAICVDRKIIKRCLVHWWANLLFVSYNGVGLPIEQQLLFINR